MNRKCFHIFIACVVGASVIQLVGYLWTSSSSNDIIPIYFVELEDHRRDMTDKDHKLRPELIINTTGCKIPVTPVFPQYYKKNWKLVNSPDCTYESVLSTLTDDDIITLNPEFQNSSCCLHEITKVKNSDNSYNLSPCENITTSSNVTGKEQLVTKCGKSLNFHATIPITTQVQQKIDYWKNLSSDDVPPSILMFGFDTMSRMHAYRSLPKTLGLMKKMGFVDFKGYHSVAPVTIPNFTGFLMGLRNEEVRIKGGCNPTWTSPFDSCPFIWKEFSAQNYVTMYIEDGSQTFNWGGQGGFRQKPTDYYVHSLFNSIKDLRTKNSPVGKNEEKLQCVSTETIPEFMIRYNKRFLQKFHDIPFFSFGWISNPIHDIQLSLGILDDELLEYFQLMDSLPNFLENTVIIFLSDHGDRYSFFMTDSVEGYIERGLPPLFIRFPETLRDKFPNLEQTLKTNTEALLTPFDLNQTLKQILFVTKAQIDSKKNVTSNAGEEFNVIRDSDSVAIFIPVTADRSSIFVPVNLNRTCESVNIHAEICVCGTSLDVDPIQNPYYLKRIIDFAERKLNEIVRTSNYKNVCKEWSASVDDVISSRTLQKGENTTDYIIQFLAKPGDAKFEAKIKVFHSNSNKFEKCELIGTFERVNSYGTQSSCVKEETDADKIMKSFCKCK